MTRLSDLLTIRMTQPGVWCVAWRDALGQDGDGVLARVGEATPRWVAVSDVLLHPPCASLSDAFGLGPASIRTHVGAALAVVPVTGNGRLVACFRDGQRLVLQSDETDPVRCCAQAYADWIGVRCRRASRPGSIPPTR